MNLGEMRSLFALLLLLQSFLLFVSANRAIAVEPYQISLRFEAIFHINEYRKTFELEPLLVHSRALDVGAYRHAQELLERGVLDHESLDQSDFVERAKRGGYEGFPCAETLGMNYPSARQMVVAWMNSPGHRDNILWPPAKEIGIGIVKDDDQIVWVMVLGC